MRDKFDEFRFSIQKRKAPKCNCQLRDTHALPCVHLLFVWRERNKGSPGTVPLQLVDIVERPYRLDAWLTMWCGVPSSSLVPLSPLGAALLRRHPCTLKEPNIDGDTIASATNDKNTLRRPRSASGSARSRSDATRRCEASDEHCMCGALRPVNGSTKARARRTGWSKRASRWPMSRASFATRTVHTRSCDAS